jgi:4-amino-4-deoxy-L-arabinose transferase-like glycosyltransferase
MKKPDDKRRSRNFSMVSILSDDSKNKLLLLLFCLSLFIRVVFFIPVAVNHTLPKYDEERYYKMAEGYSEIFRSLVKLDRPNPESFTTAYGKGTWPPLHPIVLSLGMFAFGANFAIARFMMVLLSALTTPLIFILARKIVPDKGALAASLIHIFYPSFIAYSHYLWPETTYIFLMTVTFILCLRAANDLSLKKRLFFSSLSGFFLGLSSLTKPVAWPNALFFVVLFLVISKIRKTTLLLIASFSIVFFLTITPWNLIISKYEKDDTFLSNTMGYYWFYGHNPWFINKVRTPHQNGIGLPATVELTALVKNGIDDYSAQNHVDPATAGQNLAMKEIKGHFAAFIERCYLRFRELLNSDVIITREFQRADYHPISPALCGVFWVVVVFSFILLIGLIIWGFIGRNEGINIKLKYLFLFWTLMNIAPPVLVASGPRYALPIIVFLLPFAGIGAANLNGVKKAGARSGITLLLSMVIALNALLLPKIPYPSSYYSALINKYDSIRNTETEYIDYIRLKIDEKKSGDKLSISLSSPYKVFPLQTETYCWRAGTENRTLALDIYSVNPQKPLTLNITSENLHKTVQLNPITAAAWNKWKSTGIDGIEYIWDGAGYPYQNKAYIYRDLYRDYDKIRHILPVVFNSRENQKIFLIGVPFENVPKHIRSMILASPVTVIAMNEENHFTLEKMLKDINTDDIVIAGRKSFNALILDDKEFSGKYRNFSMYSLSFAKKVSNIPLKLPSLVMIINNNSVLAKAFSRVEIKIVPIEPLKERILWDTDSNYNFVQNLHILLFASKMNKERVLMLAKQLDEKKMTREQLYSILAKEALDLYY